MKKSGLFKLPVLAAALAFLAVFSCSAEEITENSGDELIERLAAPHSVTCSGITWTCEMDGTFVFSGTGSMEDAYPDGNFPWEETIDESGRESETYESICRSIVIEEGITGISSDAFSNIYELQGLSLPKSLKSIGSGAFDEVDWDTYYGYWFRYAGTKQQWLQVEIGTYNSLLLDYSVTCSDGIYAQDTYKSGSLGENLRYTMDSAGRMVVTGYGDMTGEIPYNLLDRITSVSLPDGLTSIPDNAFNYTKIVNITIPGTVKTIGNFAFGDCERLMSITIEDGVEKIEGEAFIWDYCLKYLYIPSSVKSIGEDIVLCDNSSGKEFIPARLVVYGEKGSKAEKWCSKEGVTFKAVSSEPELKQFADPTERIRGIVSSVTADDMTDLEKITILHDWLLNHATFDKEKGIHDYAGVLLLGTGVCQSYTDAYRLMLADAGVECTAVHNLTHTWNMVKYNNHWYHVDVQRDDGGSPYKYFLKTDSEMKKLESKWEYVEATEGDRPAADGPSINFTGAPCLHNGLTFETKNKKVTVKKCASGKNTVTIPSQLHRNPVTTIASKAFSGNKTVRQVVIPGTVTAVGASAFNGCSSLTAVYVTNSDTQFDKDAFKNCPQVTIYCPEGSKAAQYARKYGIRLEERHIFYLPAALKTIQTRSFAGCPADEIVISGSTEQIKSEAFAGCEKLTRVTIPASVTEIADSAFEGCSADSLTFVVEEGSAAQSYASEKGFKTVLCEE